MFELHHGDCLATLKTFADNSVDSIVTDPPYGLTANKKGGTGVASVNLDNPYGRARIGTGNGAGGFMGHKWDSDVPSTEVWAECLRVLKPGGHLLAFAGTRTQHRMAVRIEDAGFEIRDMIAWVYGCLSEDSEVLTEDGWMPYNRAKQKNILAYDLQNDVYQWERPSRWNEYRVESDTAYRIQSDYTDQIVSRGHRCIVERGGVLTFVPADELTDVERVPYLQGDFSALPQGRGELLLQTVLREGEGLAQETFSQWQGKEAAREGACWREKPGVERGRDPLQAQGQVCRPSDQVRSLSCAPDEHGPQGRICDGASACGGNGDRQAADAGGVCSPHQPRCDGQPAGEPDAVCDQCGSQAVRAWASYQTTVATVTAIEYSGMIWCPTVSTGAFVARRNGKVFITGNSGFPKSLDVSKAIDKAAGAEREVIGPNPNGRPNMVHVDAAVLSPHVDAPLSAPATDAARQWQGWGTALKPALEPITVARKPLGGTVAENVLAHGTGALNIDGCRVATDEALGGGRLTGATKVGDGWDRPWMHDQERRNADAQAMAEKVAKAEALGRWPANLIHDGGEFLGEQARFFYCAKASKSDRGTDNTHPTVKPTDLMAYLCRLVTPPGGVVLDPFMGSGSTGKAAMREGFRFIGCELSPEYMEIARARIAHALWGDLA